MTFFTNDQWYEKIIPVGTIVRCTFRGYCGETMRVSGHMEDEDFIGTDFDNVDKDTLVWIKRLSGRFADDGKDGLRNDGQEMLIHIGWLQILEQEWDSESNF